MRRPAAPPASSTGTSRSARPAATSTTGSACAARRTCTRAPRSAMPPPRRTKRRASRWASTSTPTARTGRRATLAGFYDEPARQLRVQLPERARADDQPHPLHHLERLGDAADRSSSTNGIRLDTNYYYWPASWVDEPTRLLHRLRHADALRRPRRLADRRLPGGDADDRRERHRPTRTHINTLLDNALGAPGYYGVVTANMHTDNGNHPGQQTIVNAALARGVPVVSARQMLTWLDGRNGSSFEDLAWNGDDAHASRSPPPPARTACRRCSRPQGATARCRA